MGKSILVTGGAGFIGSHLWKRLADEGNYMVCIDDLSSGNGSSLKGQCEFIFHNVIRPFPGLSIDEIYNLACPASPKHYQQEPIKTIQTNVLGAINALNAAHYADARILQASTSEVYGDPDVHPQIEGYWGNVNPIGLRSCYDEGKRCAESLFFNYRRKLEVDIAVARIFNTYGPGMVKDDGRVMPNFIMQALTNRSITLYGDGRQTRSFCYIDDMVEGLIRLMAKDGFTGPVNLGNPTEITIYQLADKICELTNSRSEVRYEPLPEDDPRHRKPDITLATDVLGWKPKTSLDDGLLKTIEYFEGVLQHDNSSM